MPDCAAARKTKKSADTTFAYNELSLSAREWLAAGIAIIAVLGLSSRLWKAAKPFNPAPDDRLAYSLGSDYWQYERLSREVSDKYDAFLVGDSVIWGHYVEGAQTLSHHLNDLAGRRRFFNLGLDGAHPAALEGLIRHYGSALKNKDIVISFNLLWLSSERHDLRSDEDIPFNHPRLVPQLLPKVSCYKEPLADRIGVVLGRHLPFFGLAQHWRIAYWNNRDLPNWTVRHPATCPFQAWSSPLPEPSLLPSPAPDTRPWNEQGMVPFTPSWVSLDNSFQWSRFQRTLGLLQKRGNRVVVLLGPFNEHMLTSEGKVKYTELLEGAAAWLENNGIPYCSPPTLPSEMYADASHPIAEGYAALAKEIYPCLSSHFE